MVPEALRFGVVGVLQNGLNLAVFATVVGLGAPYPLAALTAALSALVFSFVLNRGFTFIGHRRPWRAQLLRYATVFATTILLGLAILALCVEWAGTSELVGQLVAISILAPVSYLAQRSWAFGAPCAAMARR